jgi:hypothetical protein
MRRRDPDELLSLADAAKLLNLPLDRVQAITDRGTLACLLTPGGRRRYRRGDIERIAAATINGSH